MPLLAVWLTAIPAAASESLVDIRRRADEGDRAAIFELGLRGDSMAQPILERLTAMRGTTPPHGDLQQRIVRRQIRLSAFEAEVALQRIRGLQDLDVLERCAGERELFARAWCINQLGGSGESRLVGVLGPILFDDSASSIGDKTLHSVAAVRALERLMGRPPPDPNQEAAERLSGWRIWWQQHANEYGSVRTQGGLRKLFRN